jgi:hypothetical protein
MTRLTYEGALQRLRESCSREEQREVFELLQQQYPGSTGITMFMDARARVREERENVRLQIHGDLPRMR